MSVFPASAVSIKNKAVLFEGPSGAGKSDLILRLLSAGADLISDDYVEIKAGKGTLFASPPKNIEGKMEVRGIGVVEKPFVKNIPVKLLITLVDLDKVPRMPKEKSRTVEGVLVPNFFLHAFECSAPEKVLLLLEKYKE